MRRDDHLPRLDVPTRNRLRRVFRPAPPTPAHDELEAIGPGRVRATGEAPRGA